MNQTGSFGLSALDHLPTVTSDPRESFEAVLVPDLYLGSQTAAQESDLKYWETNSVHGSATL